MEPQRAVGNLRGQIDVVGPVVERVEELGVGLPGPRKALVQGGAGDVLDALHQLDQALVGGRAHLRESDAAVAGHPGGDPVPGRRAEAVVPGGLAGVVHVDVDEAGGEEPATGYELLWAGSVAISHG